MHYLGYRNTQTVALSTNIGILLAMIMEFIAFFTGGHPLLTRFRIKIINSNRYFNISKAKELLGYEPIVPLIEGIKRTADYWKQEGFGVETTNK